MDRRVIIKDLDDHILQLANKLRNDATICPLLQAFARDGSTMVLRLFQACQYIATNGELILIFIKRNRSQLFTQNVAVDYIGYGCNRSLLEVGFDYGSCLDYAIMHAMYMIVLVCSARLRSDRNDCGPKVPKLR